MSRSLSYRTSRTGRLWSASTAECCKHVFAAGASRIREHFLHLNPACGVFKYTAGEAVQ